MAGKGLNSPLWTIVAVCAVIACLAVGYMAFASTGKAAAGTGAATPTPAPGQGTAGGSAESGDCAGIAPLGTTQNLQIVPLDYALTGTAVGSTTTDVYDGPTQVKANLAEATDQPTSRGKTYGLFTTASGYFSAWNQFKTACDDASPKAQVKLANIDTSLTLAFINSDGVSLNANASAQQAIGSGQGVTMKVQLKGGEAYAYETDPTCNKYTLVLKYSVVGDIDTGESKVIGCTEVAVPKAYAGTGHQAFICEGNIYNFEVVEKQLYVKAQSGQDVANGEDITVYLMPMGNIQNTITGGVMTCVAEDNVGTATATADSGVIYVE